MKKLLLTFALFSGATTVFAPALSMAADQQLNAFKDATLKAPKAAVDIAWFMLRELINAAKDTTSYGSAELARRIDAFEERNEQFVPYFDLIPNKYKAKPSKDDVALWQAMLEFVNKMPTTPSTTTATTAKKPAAAQKLSAEAQQKLKDFQQGMTKVPGAAAKLVKLTLSDLIEAAQDGSERYGLIVSQQIDAREENNEQFKQYFDLIPNKNKAKWSADDIALWSAMLSGLR